MNVLTVKRLSLAQEMLFYWLAQNDKTNTGETKINVHLLLL
jgi:hypothetical protein